MAAQEGKPVRYCDKCFAFVQSDLDYCSECGASLATGGYSEGSDSEIYPELARANLLRMRGEYKKAEDTCLSILRRFPNNVSANTLLGDLAAERGDLEHAVEWYDLALDLQPDSAGIRGKLESVKQRKAEHEAATTAKVLGLPTSRHKGALVAVILLAFILLVGVSAFYLGRAYMASKPKSKSYIDAPVDVPGAADSEADGSTIHGEQQTPAQSAPPARPAQDKDLAATLGQKMEDGARLLEASQDPRSKDLLLTFAVQTGEDERSIGAKLGASALGIAAESPKATVRAVRDGKLVFVADIKRTDLAQTETAEWQEANGNDPLAWVTTVLSNEWREGTRG